MSYLVDRHQILFDLSKYMFEKMIWFYMINGAAEGIVLGFQHYIVMLGTTVIIPSILVPLMGGGDVSINPNLI